MAYDIKKPESRTLGQNRIRWAEQQMPVLRQIREHFAETQPLKGLRVAGCLHITSETACLARTLMAGGAELALCAANPLSTQDEVAAAMALDDGVSVYAYRDEDNKTYYRHIDQVLETQPQLIMDSGADLISELHKQHPGRVADVLGATEETTTGTARLSSMARKQILKFPVLAINHARSKYLFDNRYGTGQSTLDGLMRATNMLLAGKKLVICGYGWCGKGIAMRARGLGAIVIVVEINPIHALEAAMDGFLVQTIEQAAAQGDIFITATGALNVIRRSHFEQMKSGAMLCNAGHFNSEIEVQALEQMAEHKQELRPYLWSYQLGAKNLLLLAEGRLVNLACGEGHPASVMDMSFANQALALAHLALNHRSFVPRVYPIPDEIDEQVAHLKLQAMGIEIDQRTQEQLDYQGSWELGTR
ncbi:MAG: adenosylhomocysteinase [Candidatus Sericytochromatia bacterium]|nr:adenosylhomocysteinase [Candidatus Sericytochromatia bacterium]